MVTEFYSKRNKRGGGITSRGFKKTDRRYLAFNEDQFG
jgi:hypothetical protein